MVALVLNEPFQYFLRSIDANTTLEPFGIEAIEEALAKVSKSRSKIGAQQNRLEHTVDRENVSIENLTASESRIRDADMAYELVQNSKFEILQQTGQSMLAQANHSLDSILSLLQQ